MTTDIRDRLHAAVSDTTAPAAFAHRIVKAGQARRRRRYAAGTLTAAVAVTAGAVIFANATPLAADQQVASQGSLADPRAFDWAGGLKEGPRPTLPYFAYGKLWSGERSLTLPPTVYDAVGPWAVDGGWIVMTGDQEQNFAWALLSPSGDLRDLPAETYADGTGLARIDVSPDGSRVATERWLVDLASWTATELPHAPQGSQGDVRVHAFTDQGLVYEAAPVAGGATTYLLQSDGSAVRVDLPEDAFIPDNSPGDVALGFATDPSDTCITSYRLAGRDWAEEGTGCLGKPLGEALSVSPAGRWLITDDLPRVWDLSVGEFVELDMPREVVTSRSDWLVGGIVWESDDAFLMPVADRSRLEGEESADFDQFVRVVRCSVTTGACELSDLVENRVVPGTMTNSEFHFATS